MRKDRNPVLLKARRRNNLTNQDMFDIWKRFKVDLWSYKDIAVAHNVTLNVVGKVVRQFKTDSEWIKQREAKDDAKLAAEEAIV